MSCRALGTHLIHHGLDRPDLLDLLDILLGVVANTDTLGQSFLHQRLELFPAFLEVWRGVERGVTQIYRVSSKSAQDVLPRVINRKLL